MWPISVNARSWARRMRGLRGAGPCKCLVGMRIFALRPGRQPPLRRRWSTTTVAAASARKPGPPTMPRRSEEPPIRPMAGPVEDTGVPDRAADLRCGCSLSRMRPTQGSCGVWSDYMMCMVVTCSLPARACTRRSTSPRSGRRTAGSSRRRCNLRARGNEPSALHGRDAAATSPASTRRSSGPSPRRRPSSRRSTAWSRSRPRSASSSRISGR